MPSHHLLPSARDAGGALESAECIVMPVCSSGWSYPSAMTHPTNITPTPLDERIIASGIHLELTDALRDAIHTKVGKLLRHQPRIVRVRVDLDHDTTRGPGERFVAKGRIEIGGPDHVAQAAAANAYAAVDALVSLLDRALRKRATAYASRRRPAKAATDHEAT